jgi:hypothetical protein
MESVVERSAGFQRELRRPTYGDEEWGSVGVGWRAISLRPAPLNEARPFYCVNPREKRGFKVVGCRQLFDEWIYISDEVN